MNEELLRHLCALPGVSGCEVAVREHILKEISPFADNIELDHMGNLYAFKKGKGKGPRVMVLSHMDEVGLIIKGIDGEGFLKFETVGGIDPRVLLSKRVEVGRKRIPGVISIKAVHLQEKAQRENALKVRELYIDIGAGSFKEAEKAVSLGDYASFEGRFREHGNGYYLGKAFDDRAGCMILCELLKRELPFDLNVSFTVQEEVGLRGAQVAAAKVKPEIGIVLEATTAADITDVSPEQRVTALGGGPAISIMDGGTIYDRGLIELCKDAAKKANIPYQYKEGTSGGNDAGAVSISGGGVRMLSLSVPCRYLHTPAGVISKSDLKNTAALLYEVLKALSKGDKNENN